MTFLNPLILFGLAAAAIPVILHLISLRKLRTVEFSSLTFLKELQRTKIRKLKIRQLLLLFLRTLLILLLVFAFARPTMTGTLLGGIGSTAKTTAVILVDDSFSMTAADEQGEYHKQARESGKRILELVDEDDEVYVIPFSSARTVPPGGPLRGGASGAFSQLDNIQSTPIHRTLEECLRLAAPLLSVSGNFLKEVYVISDFQQGLLGTAGAEVQEALFPPETRLFLFPVGERNVRNLAVESVSISSSILEVNKPFSLDISVGNHSEVAVENSMVSVFLNGTRVAQQGVSMESGGTAGTSFAIVPRTDGFQEIMVELEGDDLEFDNRRYLALHLPGRIRVLVVGVPEDGRYVRLAMQARQETGSTLDHTLVLPERLSTNLLTQTDVAVVLNPAALSGFQADRLNAFVRGGGGLLLFPDPQPTTGTASALLHALQLPAMQSVETPGESRQESFLEFEHAETSHPLFEGMFVENEGATALQRRVLESPRIRRFARYAVSERSASIITLSDASPFLLEQESGSGKVLMFAVAPKVEWSDFPLKGLFVPLIHRSIAYLSQEQTKQPSVVAGDPVRFHSLQGQGRLTIVTPRNLEGDFKPSQNPGMSFTGTNELGIYALRNVTNIVKTFSVNIDPAESRTARATDESLMALFERLGIPSASVRRISGQEAVQAAILETRHGVELWRHFLIAALLVALTEMLVARTGKQEVEERKAGSG